MNSSPTRSHIYRIQLSEAILCKPCKTSLSCRYRPKKLSLRLCIKNGSSCRTSMTQLPKRKKWITTSVTSAHLALTKTRKCFIPLLIRWLSIVSTLHCTPATAGGELITTPWTIDLLTVLSSLWSCCLRPSTLTNGSSCYKSSATSSRSLRVTTTHSKAISTKSHSTVCWWTYWQQLTLATVSLKKCRDRSCSIFLIYFSCFN